MHESKNLPIQPFITGTAVSNPQFSPDGKYIAYIRSSDHGKDLVIYDRNNHLSRDLLKDHKISTGTAYGGEFYGWSPDSSEIIFSSNGTLYSIGIGGGERVEIVSLDKSYHPQIDEKGLFFVVEHKTSMSLAASGHTEDGFGWPEQLLSDYSFIYDPARHPDGSIIAHVWNFPHMSWDGSKLIRIGPDNQVEDLTDGTDWVAQPRFSPDHSKLSFFNEETGWINLWIADGDGKNQRILVNEEFEHSYSTWVSGMRNQVWLDNERILFTRNRKGLFELVVTTLDGNTTTLDLPKGYYDSLHTDGGGWICFNFGDAKNRGKIMAVQLSATNEILEKFTLEQTGIVIDSLSETLVVPELIEFPTRDNETSHALLYHDPAFDRQNMPLLISVHGGPTGMATDKFAFLPQYFAKQGWLVAMINYRGSIGYGREYRNKLRYRWGDYDTWDSIDLKKDLVNRKWVHPERTAILGGSAGGFTTLYALAKFPGEFAAGVNLFGVADLFMLAEETHYLESHYLDMMVGKLPEEAENYYNRSPINFAENITDPLLTLQGEDDPVVPKNQSEMIHASVKGTKEIKIYPNEGHGFVLLKTLEDMYPRIERFLQKYVLYKVVD